MLRNLGKQSSLDTVGFEALRRALARVAALLQRCALLHAQLVRVARERGHAGRRRALATAKRAPADPLPTRAALDNEPAGGRVVSVTLRVPLTVGSTRPHGDTALGM